MLRYAITDVRPGYATAQGRMAALRAQARRWADTGIDFVQLREKALAAGELFELAVLLRDELAGSGTRLLLNARTDIAVAAGAGGVHLTASPGELTPAQVRAVFAATGRATAFVSVSCHTVAEVVRARELAADLILFGPVYGKVVAGETVAIGTGIELLTRAAQAAGSVPVLALGGVTPAKAGACIQAGAAGVAGIRLFR